MTTTLKTINDVKAIGAETLADMLFEREIDVSTLDSRILRAIVNHIQPAQQELNNEYLTGDSLCYPPYWYDQYVFPLDCAINLCQDELDERYEEESESSEW